VVGDGGDVSSEDRRTLAQRQRHEREALEQIAKRTLKRLRERMMILALKHWSENNL
jgi:hypothetical protein